MYHPDTMHELAKLHIAELHREAERERLVRRAANPEPSGTIDAVRFRDRLSRLLGALRPTVDDAAGASA